MKDQHTKIKGYRDLSQADIDLMNRIKEKGAELLLLQTELVGRLGADLELKREAVKTAKSAGADEASDELELARFQAAEPLRWAAMGKTDIQTGIMALVRAVAQPLI
ncbi:MAG TPA: hypothetical protein VF555_16585 [Variovorax sp.]